MDKQRFSVSALALTYALNSGCVLADSGSCGEREGYVRKSGLIKVMDFDCNDGGRTKLCSVLLSAPKEAEGRAFSAFTIKYLINEEVAIYLNLQDGHYGEYITAAFEVAENIVHEIEIEAVYENMNGCTLRSVLNL